MQEVFEKIIENLDKRINGCEKIIVPEIHDELDRIANETAKAFMSAYKGAIDVVRQVAVEYNNGWIPVEDELPDHNLSVEVTLTNGEREIAWYCGVNDIWIFLERADLADVIAWREPTEPYQPNEKSAKKQTNADRIHSMSVEELAMSTMCPNETGLAEIECDKSDNCNCYQCILQWLQSEVEE